MSSRAEAERRRHLGAGSVDTKRQRKRELSTLNSCSSALARSAQRRSREARSGTAPSSLEAPWRKAAEAKGSVEVGGIGEGGAPGEVGAVCRRSRFEKDAGRHCPVLSILRKR